MTETILEERGPDEETDEFCRTAVVCEEAQDAAQPLLNELDAITSWEKLLQVIAPHYAEGDRGRPPKGLKRMLRMYVAQQCLKLSDEGIEDAVYDSYAVRQFVGVDLGADEVPDATTLLKFRRLLEAHDLTRAIFEAINAHLK